MLYVLQFFGILGLPGHISEVSTISYLAFECAYFLYAGIHALQGNNFQFIKNPRTGANIKAIKDIQKICPICSHHSAKHASCFCPWDIFFSLILTLSYKNVIKLFCCTKTTPSFTRAIIFGTTDVTALLPMHHISLFVFYYPSLYFPLF